MKVAYDWLAAGARRVGKGFKRPNDDWAPIWLVMTPDGHGTLITAGTDFNTGKRLMARAVGEFARIGGAHVVAWVHSGWIIETAKLSPERTQAIRRRMLEQDGSTEGIPERVEALVILVLSATRVDYHQAYIRRAPGRPPRLGPFRHTPEASGLSGAMYEPLQAALRRLG
jgi:hypothetical protein